MVPYAIFRGEPALPERDHWRTDTRGGDAVNPLSFLILASVGNLRLPQPNLSVRYHSGLSPEFMAAASASFEKGFGMPAFKNDQIVIPALVKQGGHQHRRNHPVKKRSAPHCGNPHASSASKYKNLWRKELHTQNAGDFLSFSATFLHSRSTCTSVDGDTSNRKESRGRLIGTSTRTSA